jgi:hypothetical protein
VAMHIGLDHHSVAVACMRNFLAVQRWIEGREVLDTIEDKGKGRALSIASTNAGRSTSWDARGSFGADQRLKVPDWLGRSRSRSTSGSGSASTRGSFSGESALKVPDTVLSRRVSRTPDLLLCVRLEANSLPLFFVSFIFVFELILTYWQGRASKAGFLLVWFVGARLRCIELVVVQIHSSSSEVYREKSLLCCGLAALLYTCLYA